MVCGWLCACVPVATSRHGCSYDLGGVHVQGKAHPGLNNRCCGVFLPPAHSLFPSPNSLCFCGGVACPTHPLPRLPSLHPDRPMCTILIRFWFSSTPQEGGFKSCLTCISFVSFFVFVNFHSVHSFRESMFYHHGDSVSP